MQLLALKEYHFDQVLEISNQTLGLNYLSSEYLRQYLNSDKNLAYVIIEKGLVIGFSSITILTPAQLKSIVLKENKWFYNLSKNHKRIALRKQTIVNPNYINKGYGTKLVELSTKEVEKKTSFQLSTVWINQKSEIMESLLAKNGFENVKLIQQYWKEDSLKNNYNCPECGVPPCLCSTKVYIKKKASD
ncbi:MAG: GNAT family N-acetyltransferase [Vicingaceae bacterium]|nr:GNAT family N-acetyltransferase [Vicingaceae bacterium]